MSCSSTPAGGDSRCCPSGESYSSSAGKCLEKLTFVAVPLHYESNEFSRFKRNVKEQVNGWLEVSPLRETENPRNRVEIFYLQPSEIDEEGKKNLCKLIDVTYDEVVESEYRNEFDKAIGVSDESAGNYGGCASLPGDAEVTLDSSPESFYQEIAHNYGLEHTQDHSVMGSEPGCGAERFDEDEPNNPKSDGPAEIMNYCPGDEYYSQSSDEYDILKQRLIENGYM